MSFWIITALIGLVTGAAAYKLLPGERGGGLLVNMLIGVAVAFGAQWLGAQVGMNVPGQSSGAFAAVIGGALAMAVYRIAVTRNK